MKELWSVELEELSGYYYYVRDAVCRVREATISLAAALCMWPCTYHHVTGRMVLEREKENPS